MVCVLRALLNDLKFLVPLLWTTDNCVIGCLYFP